MQFSTEDVQAIGQKIHAVLTHGALDDEQRAFLTEVAARFASRGTGTRVTDPELARLTELVGPLSGTGKVIAFKKPAKPAPRQESGPMSWRIGAARPKARGPRRATWIRNIAIALALLAAIYAYFYYQRAAGAMSMGVSMELPLSAETDVPVTRDQFSVTDGDTIRFVGQAKGTRLVGFNTPETIEPRCAGEARLGERATARLEEIVAGASLTFRKVRCACKPGTENTRACNHGRSCGILKADGRDVGAILIGEGLAVAFECGSQSCPPTPKPWCG